VVTPCLAFSAGILTGIGLCIVAACWVAQRWLDDEAAV
jgi:hypothetical protein